MSPTEILCTVCGKLLTGGVDTYGDSGSELCWECYSEMAGEPEPLYGLAPHEHDFSQGLGVPGKSTTFLPLTRDENGRYMLPDGVEFIPDPDSPGCGMYCPPRPIGWR